MKVSLLPNEIQFHILSYLVNPQDSELRRDINHYRTNLKLVMEYYYRIYRIELVDEFEDLDDFRWLVSDLCAYMNDYYPTFMGYREHFLQICRRNFTFRSFTDKEIINVIEQKYNDESATKSQLQCYIRQLYGILTINERMDFIENAKNVYDAH